MKSSGAAELFRRVLEEKQHPKIKLLGDSITHGVGGSGFQQNGETIVEGWAQNPDGYCWANLFRDYMKDTYGAVVVNKACTGTVVGFVVHNFSSLVDADDDIIVCTIGTNNRHTMISDEGRPSKEAFFDGFYNQVKCMYDMFEGTGIPTVFVANIPASEQNEMDGQEYWRVLHMCDINDGYKKLAAECGATVISLYDLFSDYCAENNVPLDNLLCDGLHPNDQGYNVMFDLLVKAFGV